MIPLRNLSIASAHSIFSASPVATSLAAQMIVGPQKTIRGAASQNEYICDLDIRLFLRMQYGRKLCLKTESGTIIALV
ncbi:hypothetical protein B0H12DRAFT_690394 [Mycena haematopus]|nr:hypothetical protein B0H12DRAFT_690394 [Mycena haematopus]